MLPNNRQSNRLVRTILQARFEPAPASNLICFYGNLVFCTNMGRLVDPVVEQLTSYCFVSGSSRFLFAVQVTVAVVLWVLVGLWMLHVQSRPSPCRCGLLIICV